MHILGILLTIVLMLPSNALAVDVPVIHGKCADTVMYPDAVVSLINQCFATDRYNDCLSTNGKIPPRCPDICKKAINAEQPYGTKIDQLYKHGGGWLLMFSKGKQFGKVVGYSNAHCNKEPVVPKCYALPICYGGIWNIMHYDVPPQINAPDPALSPAPKEESRANGHEYDQKPECYQEIIFPKGVVDMLQKCKATGKSYNCGGAGPCPEICKLALSAQSDEMKRAGDFYNSYDGGSLMPFTRGNDFGMYVEHPYATPQCPTAAAVPDCKKSICNTF